MENIFKKLSQSAKTDAKEYYNDYINKITQIYPTTINPHILKTHIKTKNINDAEQLLRFSLVFNDLSLFTYTGGNQMAFDILQQEWFDKNFQESQPNILFNKGKLKELGLNIDNIEMSPAFVFPHGDEINYFTEQLYPFIENGKLLLQPERTLIYLDNIKNENGGRTFKTLDVSQFSSLESWETIDEIKSRPVSLKYDDNVNQNSIFEITIPYLEGINFKDLAKILEDEEDLLSGLRFSIKEATQEANNTNDLITVRRDIIDPKIDALNRKFKSTVNSHIFKVAGAAVGTVALTYTAVSTVGITAAMATICGSGGIGLLGKEYSDYREKINEIKDDPYYFLWKCKELGKKT